MKLNKTIAFLLATLIFAMFLTGCQSKAAKALDAQIDILTSDSVSLYDGKEVQSIQAQIDALSERERNSLEQLSAFETFAAEYQELEDNAVAEIESAIDALPAPDAVKLASEDAIDEAERLYKYTTDLVKARISNSDALEAVRNSLEEYKEKCKILCDTCGGDGKVLCSLCKGSGSRKVNHKTPNGKTWLVSQECYTTQMCSDCNGKGCHYIEE